ncbi:hypothetical protein LINGRAHAP2_LOCUS6763, partial [Linum grandiflorum]
MLRDLSDYVLFTLCHFPDYVVHSAEVVCRFPEKHNVLRVFQLKTMQFGQEMCTAVLDSVAHLLNREEFSRNKKFTRFCFPTSVASAARMEVEEKMPILPEETKVLKHMKESYPKSAQPISDLEYVSFP